MPARCCGRWRLCTDLTTARSLHRLALKIGADVPFFLDPRPARVGGIGERIAYLSAAFPLHLVIGVPPVAVPTAEIYRNLEQTHWSGPGPIELPLNLMPVQLARVADQ